LEALAGKIRLPSKEEMIEDIQRKRNELQKRFVHTIRHKIQCEYINFMDELAEMINAKPNPFNYLFSDPLLCYKLLFGPSLPYSYRLVGPNSWPEAADAIKTVEERIVKPLTTRKAAAHDDSQPSYYWRRLCSFIAFVAFLLKMLWY
jgi:dimethylaniline monooxygenase (N-oxide forming)